MGIERYRTVEVYFVEFRYVFNHYCLPGGLSDQPVDFGMPLFPINHDLRALGIIGIKALFDALLQAQHHRAGGIDDVDVVALGEAIGGRWFAMCTQQHLYILKVCHLFVGNNFQSLLRQALNLVAVVHDVAEAVECA